MIMLKIGHQSEAIATKRKEHGVAEFFRILHLHGVVIQLQHLTLALLPNIGVDQLSPNLHSPVIHVTHDLNCQSTLIAV